MRLTKVLPMLIVVVLVGVVVLIVVEVVDYDGRVPVEKIVHRRAPTVVRSCQDFPDVEPGGSFERGDEGATVPRRPQSALVCRWKAEGTGEVEKAERIVRSKPELADLVRTLNSLGVRSDEEWEGEYAACHEEPIHHSGVGLRYPGQTEVQLVISYNGCGYVWNIQDGTAFLPSGRLETNLGPTARIPSSGTEDGSPGGTGRTRTRADEGSARHREEMSADSRTLRTPLKTRSSGNQPDGDADLLAKGRTRR